MKRADLLKFIKAYNFPVDTSTLKIKQPKVLIVDNDQTLLDVLEKELKDKNPNIKIQKAEYGFEAGKQILLFKPDVVILDVILPGINGVQVYKNIRKDPHTKSTQIIVISEHADNETKSQFDKMHIKQFLVKPFPIDSLVTAVFDCLNNNPLENLKSK